MVAKRTAITPEEQFEEYASPGAYSPQQGSTLPPSTQGGLPFGSATPAPAQPPAPAPEFQRAPLLNLGGQPAPLEQMIQERLQAIQGYGQQPFLQRFLGGGAARGRAMSELPELQKLAATRSQDRQLQSGYLKQVSETLKEFTALPPEQQAVQRPVIEKLLAAQAQLGGLQTDQAGIQHVLKSPDITSMYREVLDEFNPQEQQAIFQQLGSVLPEKRDTIIGARKAERDQKLLSVVQTNTPSFVAQLGYSSDNPITAQEFLNNPQVRQAVTAQPGLERVFNAYVNDPKNADTVASWGVKVGKTALKEQELRAMEALQPKFPNLEPYTKTLLPFMVKGSGLAHGSLDQMAKTDPNRFAAIVTGAQDAYQQKQIDVAAAQGREAARTRLEVPEKASPAERKEITELSNTYERLNAMEALYTPEFVGSIAGRVGELREKYTGQISPKEAEFRSRVTSFSNQMIKAITGAQMSEAEATRIKAELPDVNMPPVTFEARMRQSRENNVLLMYKQRMTLEQTGVDTSKLPPLPPLSQRFRGHPDLFNAGAVKDITPQPPKQPPVSRSGLPTRTR